MALDDALPAVTATSHPPAFGAGASVFAVGPLTDIAPVLPADPLFGLFAVGSPLPPVETVPPFATPDPCDDPTLGPTQASASLSSRVPAPCHAKSEFGGWQAIIVQVQPMGHPVDWLQGPIWVCWQRPGPSIQHRQLLPASQSVAGGGGPASLPERYSGTSAHGTLTVPASGTFVPVPEQSHSRPEIWASGFARASRISARKGRALDCPSFFIGRDFPHGRMPSYTRLASDERRIVDRRNDD
jgi:hypothetical protein